MAARKKRKQGKDGASSISPEMFLRALRDVTEVSPELFYIRRPPATLLVTDVPERMPNLYVPLVLDGILEVGVHSSVIQRHYEKTQNGMHLIDAFLVAYEAGYYPPLWVLEAVAAAFKNYSEKPQANSMDTLLRLKRRRGQAPGAKAAVRRARDFKIAHDMWLLEQKFRLTVEQAAEVVQGKFGPLGKRKMRWGEELNLSFSHETLTKLYSSKWRETFDLTKQRFNAIGAHFSSEYWERFIKGFPISHLPTNLKAKLRLSTATQ